MSTKSLDRNNIHLEEAFLLPFDHSAEQPLSVGDFFTLGRDDSNNLPVADPFVSSRHARIEKKNNHFLLKDLRSRNGTFLNNVRVIEAQLKPNDIIKIGEREFLFLDENRSSKKTQFLESKNKNWQKTMTNLPMFARTNLPVLLLGPSGTGKDVLARLIHEHSLRSSGPFVSVNCSALGDSLVESELFGHIRGSFTGATNDRRGAFESARGGTLFLDEIGDLPISLQPKLLRALENKEIRPVGNDKIIATDVRIIAATHQNLNEKINAGTFRSDLFFRLHVIRVNVPSLRERLEDFPDILNDFCREMKVAFSVATILELEKHSWPGNIRELKNVVARASALYPGQRIQPEHLPCLVDKVIPRASVFLGSESSIRNPLPLLKELEKELIKKRLVANKGNQRQTAMDLNIPKSTLHDRIKSYGIDIDELLAQGL